MNKNSTIIIIIVFFLAAAVMLYFVINDNSNNQSTVLIKSFNQASSSSNTLLTEVTIDDYGNITIPESYKTCKLDSDCETVSDSCSGCSCGVLINKSYLVDYRYTFSEICPSTEEICDMGCILTDVKCLDGLCSYSEQEI